MPGSRPWIRAEIRGDTVTRAAGVCGPARICACRRVCRLCQWTRDDRPQYPSVVSGGPGSATSMWCSSGGRSLCPIHPGAGAGPERVPWLGGGILSPVRKISTRRPRKGDDLHGAGLARPVESALMSDRVKAGMARARAQGKRISRAPIPRGVQGRISRPPINKRSRFIKLAGSWGLGTARRGITSNASRQDIYTPTWAISLP